MSNFKKKNDIACIVGFAPSWIESPWERTDIDFFGLNELYMELARKKIDTPFAAWFEIHDIKNSPSKQSKEHQGFLKNCKIPLITQQHWDDYPSSEAYPKDEVIKLFNENFVIDDKHAGFFDYSNQISWMIAFAIYHGYKEIMVYGVDMAAASEYAWQKQSCYFFLGYAAGKGLKITVPKTSELLKSGALYGFESDNSRRHLVKKKIKSAQEQMHHVATRQAEIRAIHKKIDNELNNKLVLMNKDIEMIKADVSVINTNLEADKACLQLLTTMPTEIKVINAKKPVMEKELKDSIDKKIEELKHLSKELEKITKQIDQVKIHNQINHQMLNDEFKNNQKALSELTGQISNCNHLLGNNIV